MEEILHHLECINLVNNGINYISAGAGFLPSTVLQGSNTLYSKFHQFVEMIPVSLCGEVVLTWNCAKKP